MERKSTMIFKKITNAKIQKLELEIKKQNEFIKTAETNLRRQKDRKAILKAQLARAKADEKSRAKVAELDAAIEDIIKTDR